MQVNCLARGRATSAPGVRRRVYFSRKDLQEMFSLYPEPRKAGVSVRVDLPEHSGPPKGTPCHGCTQRFGSPMTETYCIDRSDLHQAGTKGSALESVLS